MIGEEITTVEDFYPQEKQEKNAYILLLNYLAKIFIFIAKIFF